MGMYKYMRDLWKQPKKNLGENYKQMLILWRKQPVTLRVERPTRIDRARSLGYKAKQGFLVIRQRVGRGGRMRSKMGRRRPKTSRRTKIVNKSYQWIAEERAVKRYSNCEVMNSYWVGQDGKNYWFEVILLDKNHPNIQRDPILKKLVGQTSRVHRGLTSAARKTRGLRNKGKGAEQIRKKD
ncbi:MAG: 50S ribosomal protein L15e [Nanoarchaeota archaeon]|nr:50S ribosomal protein L15e [Nanoarchaeota archaeon]